MRVQKLFTSEAGRISRTEVVLFVLVIILLGIAVSRTLVANWHSVTAKPSPSPSPHVASTSPSSSPSPTAQPKAPTVVKPGDPYVDLHVEGVHNTEGEWYTTANGAKTRPMLVELIPRNTTIGKCTLKDAITLDDDALTKKTVQYAVVAKQTIDMEDGLHALTLSCFDKRPFSDAVTVRVADRQPKHCKGFVFTDSDITANSLADLKSGIVGTWKGCVTNPWQTIHEVTIVFNADGTYHAWSDENIDGQDMDALYYTTEEYSSKNRYYLDDFQASKNGLGELDMLYDYGSGPQVYGRDELRNIKLMGDKLTFELWHFHTYGPVTPMLYRQ